MTRARCETCHRPMASTADWERTYGAHSGGERALCWSGDALCKSPPRVLVREWWEIWWIKDGESMNVQSLSGRELRFALLADAREYVALRANQYYRIKRVRRYRVAR